jgi:hypothetical protein
MNDQPVTFPLAVAGGHEGDATEQADQCPLGGGARSLRLVHGPVHPLGGTPNADSEAGLRRVNAAALRAPPGRDVPGESSPASSRLSTASAARCAACQPSGPGSLPASASTTRRNAPTRARPADRSASSLSKSSGADELQLMLGARRLTSAPALHRPAADARRHRDAPRRLHPGNHKSPRRLRCRSSRDRDLRHRHHELLRQRRGPGAEASGGQPGCLLARGCGRGGHGHCGAVPGSPKSTIRAR